MRALVIFPGALGDVVLLAPALLALARRARVELSVGRAVADLLGALVPPAVVGPPADGRALGTLFGPTLDAGVAAWLRGADALHAFLGGGAEADVRRHARIAGITEVCVRHVVRGEGATHAAEEYARALGVGWPLATPGLAVAPCRSSSRRLVMHPGAGAVAKRWSPSGFAAVAARWRSGGGEVVVLLGPAERDEAPAWRGAADVVVADREIMDAAALLAGASAYVGNDSGPSHVAGAVGCRGAVLFGPTCAARWRPLGGALAPVRFDDAPEPDVVERVWRALARPLP